MKPGTSFSACCVPGVSVADTPRTPQPTPQPTKGQVKRNHRRAAKAASAPHTANPANPNQSTDKLMACDRASVSAPDGVTRAAHLTAVGTMCVSRVKAPKPAKTNHNRLASASTISARKVPPSSKPSAAKPAVPSAITPAPKASAAEPGRQPNA